MMPLTLEIKPYTCPHCSAILGSTDGLRLQVCTVVIHTKTVLQCCQCGATRTWQPTGLSAEQMVILRREMAPHQNGNGNGH